jgi:5-methylcytosine-specific restriction protein A
MASIHAGRGERLTVARRHLSTRERVRVFEAANGICHICSTPIQPGQRWEVSHPTPLAAGGEDTPENRQPAHYACHRTVTNEKDAPLIAKIRRIRAKHIGATRPRYRWPKRKLQSRNSFERHP